MESIVKYNVAGDIETLQRTGKMLAMSGYFDAKGDMATQIAQMATKILAGAELGFGPFASVNGIYLVQGKPTVSANLMASAVKSHLHYDYRVRKMDAAECSIEFFETVGGKRESLGVSTFTIQDAEKAGLLKNPTWKNYPKNMLFARAMSNGVRWYCPDVFSGNAVYSPEELGAPVDEEGNVIDAEWQTEPAQPANANHPEVEFNGTGEAPDHPFEGGDSGEPEASELPETLRKALHAAGRELYGDDWDTKRPELVKAATKKRTTSSKELTPDEAQKLIDGIHDKLASAKKHPEAA